MHYAASVGIMCFAPHIASATVPLSVMFAALSDTPGTRSAAANINTTDRVNFMSVSLENESPAPNQFVGTSKKVTEWDWCESTTWISPS